MYLTSSSRDLIANSAELKTDNCEKKLLLPPRKDATWLLENCQAWRAWLQPHAGNAKLEVGCPTFSFATRSWSAQILGHCMGDGRHLGLRRRVGPPKILRNLIMDPATSALRWCLSARYSATRRALADCSCQFSFTYCGHLLLWESKW